MEYFCSDGLTKQFGNCPLGEAEIEAGLVKSLNILMRKMLPYFKKQKQVL